MQHAHENVLQVLPVEDIAEVFDRAESVIRTLTGDWPRVPSLGVTQALFAPIEEYEEVDPDAFFYPSSCTIFGYSSERGESRKGGFAGLLARLRSQRLSWTMFAVVAPIMLVAVFVGSVALGRAAASAETVASAQP